ncbi:caskin-2 isoform X3 [Procambarus clarkii]|uniref:caskin-2 isoform X3 n=1 Tax=Procambarus clarkii TaxID=6728 RepID=UPI003744A36C
MKKIFSKVITHHCDDSVGGMSGRGKPAAAVKVSPPTVPDSGVTHRHSGSSFSSGVYSAGDQRSSYSSSVSDENPPASPRSPARGGVCDHGRLGSGGGGGTQLAGTNSSPSHYNNQQFTFPVPPHQQQVPQFAHLMCPKTSPGSPHHLPQDTTYYLTYQHQTSLEDQGIDVQSPGRSSPGSGSGSSTTGSTASSGGCRNSTTSLDSGRASTTTHSHQHRLSGQSYDSGSILRHSYHSSSSSLGSMEHDPATHVNVPELLNNGVRDSEVLGAWLTDLRFEEYYEKFISAGYDMPTISRMTPEDLNAIGITKPAHRKKLKAEITRLNISDGLPDFIPGRLEDWLSILRLEEYTASLRQQKYTSVEQMTQLTWEDLEDIGITKLGHQKKVMLAIKRVKDIMAGKKFTNTQDPRQQSHYGAHEIMISREASEGRDQYASVPEFRTFSGPGHYGNGEHNRLSGPADSGVHYGVQTHYVPGVQYGPMPPPPQAHVHPMSQQTGPFHPSNQFSAPQGPSPPGSKLANIPPHPLPGPGQVQYRPDLVAVQVRPGGRGRSIESLEEPIYGTYHTFHPDSRLQFVQGPMSLGSLPPRPFLPTSMGTPNPQRSMDDGDITPTNEYANNYEGGGTLPRPRTANKLRPVAKVTAKTRVDVHEVPQFIKDGMNLKKPSQKEEINMKDLNIKELNLKALNRQNSEKIYNTSQGTGSSNNTPQGTPKKIPPPPPRRSNSISETSKEAALQESQYGYLRRGLSYGYMGIKNNLQPDVTPDLPPPPAPPDSANHQHLPDDFPPPPPPLTCVTMASSTRITASSTITTSSITSDSLATSQTSTTSSEDDVSTGFRPRRNDSNASFKSTSSTDSESLPFANENAGTIKQRACRPHPGLTVLDTRNSPHSSPRSSPALRRKDAQPPLRQNPIANTESTGQIKSNSSSPDGTGDVLNDIGNMLANLTDELDAMLEQEVILKN